MKLPPVQWMDPRLEGVFVVPPSDVRFVGNGNFWDFWIRVFYDGVRWQEHEGFRIWAIPSKVRYGQKGAVKRLRERAKEHGVTKILIYDVRPPAGPRKG